MNKAQKKLYEEKVAAASQETDKYRKAMVYLRTYYRVKLDEIDKIIEEIDKDE